MDIRHAMHLALSGRTIEPGKERGIGRYTWIVFSVALSSFIIRLNMASINVSLPTISQYFDVDVTVVSKLVTGYFIVITSALLLLGNISDRVGLKKIFLLGSIVLATGSLLCGLAPCFWMLLGSRFIQGTGAAMLLATSYAIISRFLPPDRVGSAFGITTTASALGVALGAPLGGFFTDHISWHSVFFFNVPACLVAMIIGFKHIPNDTDKDLTEGSVKKPFDITGACLSALGLALFLYGVNRGNHAGWLSPVTVVCILTGIAILVVFVARDRKRKESFLQLELLNDRRFRFSMIATFFSYVMLSGNAFILPFYLNTIQGLNAGQTGIALLFYALTFVFLSSYAGRLADCVRPAGLCMVAMLSASACTFIYSVTLHQAGLFSTLSFLLVFGTSYVFFYTPNNKHVMEQAPRDRQGRVSGLFVMIGNLGMIFGISVFETAFSRSVPPEELAKAAGSYSAIPKSLLLSGFSNAYIVGAICCALAAVAMYLSPAKNRHPLEAAFRELRLLRCLQGENPKRDSVHEPPRS